MRKTFLTHVPMTTLPVALLRPVTECEDAVSFQLHFRLLFNFFCFFFPWVSLSPASKALKFQYFNSEHYETTLSQSPRGTAIIIKPRKQSKELNIWKFTLTTAQIAVSVYS